MNLRLHRLLAGWMLGLVGPAMAYAELHVGAAKVDVTPTQLPVLVNGSMTSRTADQVTTRVHARAIVLDDGQKRLALVVVDSCMVPKQLCDEAKRLAATRTEIHPECMMVSATHTHTAPSSFGALGTDADPSYVPFLRQKIAEAIAQAESKLQPAVVGWGSAQAPDFTALRRWIRRPDRIVDDPFGNPTVRASMHSARNPENAVGPTGPEDPELSLIAFESPDGRPIAALCNFSMHYFGGEKAISADYFGLFCDGLEQHLGRNVNSEPNVNSEFDVEPVAIMSHGCSGDIWRRDYMQAKPVAEGSIQEYSLGLLEFAKQAYSQVRFQSDAALDMQETRLPMKYRVPNRQRLEWAQNVVQSLDSRQPTTQPEIYAREQLILHELQATEIVTQAIRIGDIAIATTPNETYALTGLKLKHQSPAAHTMVIELANGADGYVPPPEQHALGGYNTWPARSAGLETTAEPRIVATDLAMLESIFKRPRRTFSQTRGPLARSLLDLKPVAYWRLDEFSPGIAKDSSGADRHALYEPGVVYFLDGPEPELFSRADQPNRCVHVVGGRVVADLPNLDREFSIVLSVWNGMPLDARPITGWFVSRDWPDAISPLGIHLGLERSGRLALQLGTQQPVLGAATLKRWQWYRVALVRTGRRLQVFLGEHSQAAIDVDLENSEAENAEVLPARWFFGGRSDRQDGWEGKLDEVTVFDRALSGPELQAALGR